MANASPLEAWLTWAFSPAVSAILVTLLVSLLSPIIIHYYLYRKAVAKELPTFLLLGPSGAGKTTLLTLLSNGSASPTHVSQEPQTAVCQLPESARSSEDRYRSENDTDARQQPKFLFLDTPGHGKLRHHAISSIANATALKGLIYVVDSASMSSTAGLTEAAEYLHDILLMLQRRYTQAKSSKDPPSQPVLVAANKQDVFTSLPAGLVKTKLEDEIAKVRQTKSRGLLDSGIGADDGNSGDEESNWLGEFGAKSFKFSQMEEHGVDVDVIGGNARGEGNEPNKVDEWWAWIGEHL